jgi:hypothetical protein
VDGTAGRLSGSYRGRRSSTGHVLPMAYPTSSRARVGRAGAISFMRAVGRAGGAPSSTFFFAPCVRRAIVAFAQFVPRCLLSARRAARKLRVRHDQRNDPAYCCDGRLCISRRRHTQRWAKLALNRAGIPRAPAPVLWTLGLFLREPVNTIYAIWCSRPRGSGCGTRITAERPAREIFRDGGAVI